MVTGALVLLLAVAWAHTRSSKPSDFERFHNRIFTCMHAVNAEMIDIDVPEAPSSYTRVRLWGVETIKSAGGDLVATAGANVASALAPSLVEKQPVRIVLSPQRTRDRDGRLLAYVYLSSGTNELMLNEEIITRGLGFADRRYDHPWRLRFEQLEDHAQKQRQGVWGSSDSGKKLARDRRSAHDKHAGPDIPE